MFKKIISAVFTLALFACVFSFSAIGASFETTLKNGDVFTLGSYPQTKVTDPNLSKELSDKYSGINSNSWMPFSQVDMWYLDVDADKDGKYDYRGIQMDGYRPYSTSLYGTATRNDPENTEQDENGYFSGNTYWFKYEPLQWTVLDAKSGLSLCNKIIDAREFNRGQWTNPQSDPYSIGYQFGYADYEYKHLTVDWDYSNLRTWLSGSAPESLGDYFMKFFTTEEKSKIRQADNRNSNSAIGYTADNTTDSAFILSFAEASQYGIGWMDNAVYPSNPLFAKEGTDYAKCQGLWVCRSGDDATNGKSCWRIRSFNFAGMYFVDETGNMADSAFMSRCDPQNVSNGGVCPAIYYSPVALDDKIDTEYAIESEDTVTVIPGTDVSKISTLPGINTAYAVFYDDPEGFGHSFEFYGNSSLYSNIEPLNTPSYVRWEIKKDNGKIYQVDFASDKNGDGKIDREDLLLMQKDTSVTVTLSQTKYTYSGKANKPAVTVKNAAGNVIPATEYTVSYKNNINAGKASVTVKFTNNYSDTKTLSFTIAPKQVSADDETISLANTKYTYTGNEIKPAVTVRDAAGNVISSADYALSYENNINAGKASVTVIFTNNYSGSGTLSFTIVPKQVKGLNSGSEKKTSIKLTWNKTEGAKYYKVEKYNASTKKWETVKTVKNNYLTVSSLKAGTKYKFRVTALDSTKTISGKVSAVLKTGTLTAAPTVTLKSAKSKTATASWKKVTGASKYIVYKSTDGKKWKKAATVTATTYTIKKLTGAKPVYVKVCTVNAYGKNSVYSSVKKVTVKK